MTGASSNEHEPISRPIEALPKSARLALRSAASAGRMYITHQQEEFSRAYVHAIATVAGFKVVPGATPDDDSVDLSIASRGPRGLIRSPRIDVQLKCHRGAVDVDPWPYALRLKNYEDLRHTDYQAPRILVVVVVPEDVEGWLAQSEEALVLRRCGYWRSLRGEPETTNETSVTVTLPRSNVFSVESLRSMMERVGAGGTP